MRNIVFNINIHDEVHSDISEMKNADLDEQPSQSSILATSARKQRKKKQSLINKKKVS